jgi:Domain of unknown function (DUF4214)
MRGGTGAARGAPAVAALLLLVSACTQGGVAPDVVDAGGTPAVATAPAAPATTAVRGSNDATVSSPTPTDDAPATSFPPALFPPTLLEVSSTTIDAGPPTLADEFAAALAPVGVTVLGATVPTAARDAVGRLWLLVGRPPTDVELTTAVTAAVRDGVPLDALATLLLHSRERAVGSPDAPPEQFVAELYEPMLGRPAKPGEVAAWVAGLADGMSVGDVAVGFAESPEAVRRTGTVPNEAFPAVTVAGVERSLSDSVVRLYLGLLLRLPTIDELVRDIDRYEHGALLGAIADDIVESAEYRQRRPDGDAAAVLAGLFEDVLGNRPTPAVIAGWADQLDAGASAGEVASAFTESAGVVARTGTERPVAPDVERAAPTPVAIMPGTEILAVGDSIMLGASSALQRQFPGIAVDARVGRQFSAGVEIVRALAEQGTIPGTVVIHLGTNGTISGATCDEMLRLLAGKSVVLVNVHVPRPWEGPSNDVLEACATRHGAAIVDWHTNAVGLAHDGYHLSGSGPQAYATLIAATVAAS